MLHKVINFSIMVMMSLISVKIFTPIHIYEEENKIFFVEKIEKLL